MEYVEQKKDRVDLQQFYQESLLGNGCFGRVFKYTFNGRGENKFEANSFAVKIIDGPESKQQRREIAVMTLLKHKYIVKFHSWSEGSSSLLLVMELCCENLDTYRRRWKNYILSEKELMFFWSQLASGLAYLHSKDWVHRDLKPENILVNFPSGIDPYQKYKLVTLKLADFGLARFLGDNPSKSTVSVVGNRKYAAPEVMKLSEKEAKEAKYDAKAADVFSLGALLHYIMQGKVPFAREQLRQQAFDVSAVLQHMVGMDNARLLLNRMLTWKPEQRCSMLEVTNDRFLKKISKRKRLARTIAKVFHDPVMQQRQAKMGIAKNHTLIVLVGPSGAGKTSTILNLLGKKKDFEKSDFAVSNKISTTRETFELRLKIESDDPELQHMTLGIVDTPGLNDTAGKDQDARNMACIETFLNNHECLQPENAIKKYPNLVLFVFRGDLNRDFGNKSDFVRSLKQLLCDDLNLTDGKNLVIVLTHALGIESNAGKWHESSQSKKKDIEDFVFKVKGWRVPVVLLDNHPPTSIKRANDWTVFPDGTKQPLNLFECIANDVLGNKGDLIGKRVIREYFHGKHDGYIQTSKEMTVQATMTTKKKKVPRNDQEEKFYNYLKDFDFPSDDETSEDENDDNDGGHDTEANAGDSGAMQVEKNETEIDDESENYEDAESSGPSYDLKKSVDAALLLHGYNIEEHRFAHGLMFQTDVIKNMDYFRVIQEQRVGCIGTKSKKQLAAMTAYEIANATSIDSITVKVEIGKIEITEEMRSYWQNEETFKKEFLKELIKVTKKKYSPTVAFVKTKYQDFYAKYGQAIVVSSKLGGQAVVSFSSNDSKMRVAEKQRSRSGPPQQLIELLQEQFGVKQVPDIRMFFTDQPFVEVADTGNQIEIDFSGGSSKDQTPETILRWKESLKASPVYLVEPAGLMHLHDLIRSLDWLKDHEEMAENLRYAYDDLFSDDRVAVAEKDEAKDARAMRAIYAVKDDREKDGAWGKIKKWAFG